MDQAISASGTAGHGFGAQGWASRVLLSRLLLAALLGFGVALRLAQYLANRSLWMDEASLAVNIVSRTPGQLLLPLERGQAAPIGFLLAQKTAVEVFGNNEYALRLVPLLSGVAALFVFLGLARRVLRPEAVPVALGLFAVAGPLVYYASEAKQYAGDVAVATVLWWWFLRAESRPPGWVEALLLGLVGGAAVWCSHPAAFVLAGAGGVLLATGIADRAWSRVVRLAAACGLWLASFAGLFVLSLRHVRGDPMLLDFWAGGFMPLPPTSYSELKWFPSAFFRIFDNPGGLALTGLAGFLFLVGAASLFGRRPRQGALLLAPVLVVLLASGLRQYPFAGRLILFVVPVLLLLIGEGVDRMGRMAQGMPLVSVVLVALLFYHPLISAVDRLLSPRTLEEIKPVLGYVQRNYRDGDLLYVYYGADAAFEYYRDRYGLRADAVRISAEARDDWGRYARDMDQLIGRPRVWVIFSHFDGSRDERRFFLYYLDQIGQRLDLVYSVGAEGYLYDLSR